MPCPAGLINLISHIADGTRLQKQLALRREYVSLFGRDAGRPFEAGLRVPANRGMSLSHDLEERLLEAIRKRERSRGGIAPRLMRRVGTIGSKLREIRGAEPLLRTASSAVSSVVHFFRLAYAEDRTSRKT
jgi:hypothetical protein